MSKEIDWLYHRKHCTSCQRARDFLDTNQVTVREQTDAVKDRRGMEAALELARSVDRIVVARGKRLVTLDVKSDAPDDRTIVSHLLGPTGNLRAPTIRKGRVLLVGFNQDAYLHTICG